MRTRPPRAVEGAVRVGLCLIGVGALLSCSDPASPPGGGDGRPIVFVARTERLGVAGPPGIFSVRSDGGGLQRLTLGAGEAMAPAWSRDGSRIAFASSVDGGAEIWVMQADGSGARRASTGFRPCVYDYTNITWSPDGNRLAAECLQDTWIMDLVLGTGYSLTDRIGTSVSAPDWSAESNALLFSGDVDEDHSYDASVVNADGGTPSRIFGPAADPTWSPDGRFIAYTAADPFSPGHFELFIANADGSNAHKVIETITFDEADEGPTWSPDGEWLSFHRRSNLCANVGTPPHEVCNSHWAIHIVRKDGRGLRKLTPDSLQATRPSWW